MGDEDSNDFHPSGKLFAKSSRKKHTPRTVILYRDECGFGFTLRHFIVYPPTNVTEKIPQELTQQASTQGKVEQWVINERTDPMDTIFIREVKGGSPAHRAGLMKGDRIIAINSQPLTGKTYSDIIQLIRTSGRSLHLLVVPKEDDILQLYFANSAYQPVQREHKQNKYHPTFPKTSKQSSGFSNKRDALVRFPEEFASDLSVQVKESRFKDVQRHQDFSQSSYLCEHNEVGDFYLDDPHYSDLPSCKDTRHLINKSSPFHPSSDHLFPISESHNLEERTISSNEISGSQERDLFSGVPSDTDLHLFQNTLSRPHRFHDTLSNLLYGMWYHKIPTYALPPKINLNQSPEMSDTEKMAHSNQRKDSKSAGGIATLISRTMKAFVTPPSDTRADCHYFIKDAQKLNCECTDDSMTHSFDSMDSYHSLCVSDGTDSNICPSECSESRISHHRPRSVDLNISENSDYWNGSKSTHSSIFNNDTDYRMHTSVANGISNNDAGCCNMSSINLVAQRCHQFESGSLLAESLERMNLYKSELARMSNPSQTRIVSIRAAHFENMSPISNATSESTHSLMDDSQICTFELLSQDTSSILNEENELCTVTKTDEKGSCTDSYTSQNSTDINACKYDNLQTDVAKETSVSSAVAISPAGQISNGKANIPCNNTLTAGVVYRRKTVPASEQDECHVTRRISYLRATAEDRLHVDSEFSDDESSEVLSPNREHRIQKLKAFFGEKTPRLKYALQSAALAEDAKDSDLTEQSKSVYGWLICKVVSVEGKVLDMEAKRTFYMWEVVYMDDLSQILPTNWIINSLHKRSSDRSWRHVWAILRNDFLYLLRERREPSKTSLSGDEHLINVKQSIANIANDYLKRKHVLRLLLPSGTEYLVQAESHSSMMEWLQALQALAIEISKCPDWAKNSSVLEKAAAYEQQIQTNKNRCLSHHSHHPVRKLVFRHRSPSEHSPTVKTRRASQGDELALSKFGVMWRDRMVQGWKRVHGSSAHDPPKGATFGVRLEYSPASLINEHVPLIVELCARIVETRGLDVVGIYRVPGNNAAVSMLTDAVNQGLEDIDLEDTRWNDVNIVSSLLKAFFRKLPEPLLTSHMYPKFITASKLEDPVERLATLKKLLHSLPVQHFETLRFLMYHLRKVVAHADINKMEARNLAIVFGPTLVRSVDNNMVAMVTDMSHQCYLIETMITYADWLFEDCGNILPLEINIQEKRKTHPPTIHSSALLSNINKLECARGDALQDILPHELLSSFRNTASRHLRPKHRPKKESENQAKRSGVVVQEFSSELLKYPTENDIGLINVDSLNRTELPALDTDMIESCSTLISGSSKSKQRSLSGERSRKSNIIEAKRKSSTKCYHSVPENHTLSTTNNLGDEVILHTYDELSALTQEKIKNFEEETKAMLKRGNYKPRVSATPGHVEWEQIEREWQKAKLELEQEDLLDHLADDPSFLSYLLNRREEISVPDVIHTTDQISSHNNIHPEGQGSTKSNVLTSKKTEINKALESFDFLDQVKEYKSEHTVQKPHKDFDSTVYRNIGPTSSHSAHGMKSSKTIDIMPFKHSGKETDIPSKTQESKEFYSSVPTSPSPITAFSLNTSEFAVINGKVSVPQIQRTEKCTLTTTVSSMKHTISTTTSPSVSTETALAGKEISKCSSHTNSEGSPVSEMSVSSKSESHSLGDSIQQCVPGISQNVQGSSTTDELTNNCCPCDEKIGKELLPHSS